MFKENIMLPLIYIFVAVICDIVVLSTPVADVQFSLDDTTEKNKEARVKELIKADLSVGELVPRSNSPEIEVISESQTPSVSSKEKDSHDESDTKKHYYLLKISEYYDFIPYYHLDKDRRDEDKNLQFEIDDLDDSDLYKRTDNKEQGYKIANKVQRDISDSKNTLYKKSDHANKVKKRDIGEDTLRQSVDVLQDYFVKRDINYFGNRGSDNNGQHFSKRDLGNFEPSSLLFSADSDDPSNNNIKYIAYVPFFKVRKYYIERKRLDLGG